MGSKPKTGGLAAFAFLRKKRFIDVASAIVAGLLGAGAILAYVVAILRPHASVPFSVVGSLLTFCCGGVAGVAVWYGKLVRFEEYTPPHALAIGYVANFVAPVVKKLADPDGEAAQGKFFFIYLPDRLSKNPHDAIESLRRKIKNTGGYRCTQDPVGVDGKTTRQVDKVIDAAGRARYLDFPRTLSTLADFINYKTSSREDSFGKDERAKKERDYLKAFRKELEKLIEDDEELKEHVDFLTPSELDAWLKEA